jgi:hypothetical protein
MGKKKQPVALLIDADILCYRAAATIETRTVEVKHIKSGRVREFGTRTEFKGFLKAKDFEYNADDYEFTDIQTPQDISHATYIVKNQIKRLKDKFKPEAMKLILGGKQNFRDELLLPKKYKGNRKDFIRPVHLQAVREYVQQVHQAEVVNGHEADDALIYYGYELLNKDYDTILATIDKDAKAYSGLKFYDFTKEESEPLLIPDLGELHLNEKDEVKGSGFLWYCFQHGRGDSTDFFCPYELSGKRFGDKAAYKLLKDCKSHSEALAKVVWQFKQWYPDVIEYTAWNGEKVQADWKYLIDVYFKCCRMKESKEDDLDFTKFAARYGVDL